MGPLYVATGNNCHNQSASGRAGESPQTALRPLWILHPSAFTCVGAVDPQTGSKFLFFRDRPSGAGGGLLSTRPLGSVFLVVMRLSVFFLFSQDLTGSSLGIIKRCDITYLQEPRRATCPVNVGEDQCMSLLIGCGFKTE